MEDNPATRLKKIMLDTSRFSNDSTRRVWAHYFKLEETDTTQIVRRLLMIIDLFREVQQLIRWHRSEAEAEIIFKPLVSFEALILPSNIDVSFRTLNQSHIRQQIDLCESIISERELLPEKIDKIDRDELSSDIENLITKVKESDIRDELKEEIIEKLRAIQRALSDYDITGNKGLRQSAEGLFGTIIANFNELQTTSIASFLWTFSWNVLNKAAIVTTIYDQGQKLISEASRLLGF